MRSTSLSAPRQRWCRFGVLGCVAMLAGAFWLQFKWDLEPCPLCIFQRLVFFALLFWWGVGSVHPTLRRGDVVYYVGSAALALVGMGLAGRHVWLQHLPASEVPACGPGLDFMLEALPLWDTLRRVLQGSGECAKVEWTLWGMSIPQLTLIVFVVIFVFAMRLTWRRLQARY